MNSLAETEETLGMSTEMLQRLVLLEQLSLIRIQKHRLKSQNETMCTPIFWLPMDNSVTSGELFTPAIDIRLGNPTSVESPNSQSTNKTIQRNDISTPSD